MDKSLSTIPTLLLAITASLLTASHVTAQSQNTMHIAAENGDLDQVTAIFNTTHDVNVRDQRARTPLMAAASKGQVRVMSFLFANNADANLKDNTGATALHLAASGGYPDAVSMLLANGADATLRTQSGLTALDIAQTSQNAEIISILQTRLGITAALPGDTDRAKTLRDAALAAISDANQVIAAIDREGLRPTFDSLTRAGQSERRAWTMRSPGQRTRLCNAVQTQIRAELRFVEDTARTLGTGRVASDANGLQNLWERRLRLVSDRMKEVRRQEMAQAQGRTLPAQTRPAVSRVGAAPQGADANAVAGYFSASATGADQERLASSWATSSTDTSADQLLTDFNDLVFQDLGYMRTEAMTAKAPSKTLAAIDAVILIRSQRTATVRADLQNQSAANSATPSLGQGPVQGQQQGRRGSAMQPGQGQGSGYNRGTRRGRY